MLSPQLCRPPMSAVKMSIDSVGRQCRSLLSAVNVGPCVAGLTEFSRSMYSPTVAYGVYGVVIGNSSMEIIRFASLYFRKSY